jgi:hypothetical protein
MRDTECELRDAYCRGKVIETDAEAWPSEGLWDLNNLNLLGIMEGLDPSSPGYDAISMVQYAEIEDTFEWQSIE